MFYAFNTVTGEVHWAFDASTDGASQFHGNPLIRDSIIFFGSDAGNRSPTGTLYALNRLTGKLLWKTASDAGLPSDLCAHDSLLYVVTGAGRLVAVETGSGGQVWTFEGAREFDSLALPGTPGGNSRSMFRSSPALYQGKVLLARPDSTVHCLDARTGRRVWSRPIDRRITSQLCVVNETVAFGTENQQMVYLDAATGTPVRRQHLDVTPVRGMSYTSSRLVFLGAEEDSPPRHLCAIAPADGEVRWQVSVDDSDSRASWYSPRVHIWEDKVIVGSTNGRLAAYSLDDGALIWSCHLTGRVRGIGHDASLLFVGTYDGMLYALKIER